MKSIFILGLLITSSAFSAETKRTLPIEPVYASDQMTITSPSLQEELEQFRAISQWQLAKTQIDANRLRYDKSTLDLDRAKARLKAGTITEVAFGAVYFEHRVLEGEMIRLPNEMVKAQMAAQFHMLRVLELGNPGVDHRARLAKAIIDGLKLQITTLNSSLEVAKTASNLTQGYWERGKVLLATNAIAAVNLEKRELAAKTALIQIREITNQIELAEMALASFEKSSTRL